MTIDISPILEERLKTEAARRGLNMQEYAARVLEQSLDRPQRDQATLDLLAKWEEEERTDDPEELARREKEGEEFMQNLARNRIEMEGPNARKLWP
jgi:hypothetical protein